VAGLVFSVLLIVALVLVQLAIGTTPGDAGVWLTDQPRREAVQVALAKKRSSRSPICREPRR
jgi:hypothetical protein